MKILVIGVGMYVTGRGTSAFGTIFPSIIEFQRINKIKKLEVIFTGHNFSNIQKSKKKVLKALKISKIDFSKINFKVSFYPNKKNKKQTYKDILKNEKNLSCAIVAVPDHLHYQVINECLDHDLHTLAVKPFTIKTNDAYKLIEKKNKKKIFGLVEFHKRFDKHNLLLKNAYDSKRLGVPLSFNVEYSQKKIVPEELFRTWAYKTNIFQYLGVHYVDLVYFVTRATPVRILAIGQKNWLRKKGINTYDSIQCIIEWKTKSNVKFTQTLSVNWIDPNNSTAMSTQKIKFLGTKGNFESDQKARGIKIVSDDAHVEEPNPDFNMAFKVGNSTEWRGYGIQSITQFLLGVRKITNKNFANPNLYNTSKEDDFFKYFNFSSTSFEEAAISTAVLESANKSLKNNSNWQKIKLKK